MTAIASKLYQVACRPACRLAVRAAIIAVICYGATANLVIAGFSIFVCHRSFLLMKIKRPLRVSFYQVSSPHAPHLRKATPASMNKPATAVRSKTTRALGAYGLMTASINSMRSRGVSPSRATRSMRSKVSKPSSTLPNIVYLPSR